MRRTGFLAELGEDHVFPSTQQALDAPLPAMGDDPPKATDPAPPQATALDAPRPARRNEST
jgi:hypothetical protein